MESKIIPGNICVSDINLVYPNIQPNTWNPNAEASFECSVGSVNQELFDQLIGCSDLKTFSISCDMPIMIQARWHKKSRIRKKWLKRYGLKLDTVQVEIPNVSHSQFDTINNEFEFNTKEIHYKFRSDQLRRGIEIKM